MAEPNLAVVCPKCHVAVTTREAGSFQVGDEMSLTRFTLGRCPKCSSPLLLRNRGRTLLDPTQTTLETFWKDPVVVFPAATFTFSKDVPMEIAASYAEALRCFNRASAYTGTAILCRRTLEGICVHFGEKKGSLAQKLKALKDKGTIDSRVYDWANDVLRTLGNDAAHDVNETIEEEDAKHALDFTRAIIEYLFVFQAAYDRFKAEREERKASKAPKAEEPA